MRYGLRIHEIAERHGKSVSLISKLAMLPDFPPVEARVGRATFYDREAVDYYF